MTWYQLAFGGFNVHGIVLDGASGQPIEGTRVWSPRMSGFTAADYYRPTVYPSTFTAGVPRAVVRPWLQYFDDYPWATRLCFDAQQIEAQKKAVADSTVSGRMFWNAGSLFTRGGLAPRP